MSIEPDCLFIPADPGMLKVAKSIFGDSHTVNNSSLTYDNICASQLSLEDVEKAIGHPEPELPKNVKDWYKLRKELEYKVSTGTDNSYAIGFDYEYYNIPPTTMSFKAGDKITLNEDGRQVLSKDEITNLTCTKGGWCEVEKIEGDYVYYHIFNAEGNRISNGAHAYYIKYFRLISSPTTPMGILDFAQSILLGEPEKSFREAGLKGTDGKYTQAAKDLFIAWLMAKDKDFEAYLTDVATKYIEEQKKKNK
jgi:hypothetical protein